MEKNNTFTSDTILLNKTLFRNKLLLPLCQVKNVVMLPFMSKRGPCFYHICYLSFSLFLEFRHNYAFT